MIYVLDSIFLVDMIMCFFTTFSNEETLTEVTDHKALAKNYLGSWFLVDLFSILPINMIVKAFQGEAMPDNALEFGEEVLDSPGRGNMVIRLARIGKLYKLMRLFRLVKVFKLLKNKDKL
jgi:hypothetical protein